MSKRLCPDKNEITLVTVTCIQKRKITFYKIKHVHPQTSSKTMKKLNKGSMSKKEDEKTTVMEAVTTISLRAGTAFTESEPQFSEQFYRRPLRDENK
jgi:hypothetical protein